MSTRAKKATTPRKAVAYRLHPRVVEALNKAAAADGRSRASFLERLLVKALNVKEA